MKPYPLYRDSGIEWLGEIPEHWETDRLRWSITMCKNGIWGSEPEGDEGMICVRVADFDRAHSRVNLDDPTYRLLKSSEKVDRILQSGDLLLEKSGGGEKQPVGFVVLYAQDEDAVCSNFIARMPIAPRQDSRYWNYLNRYYYFVRVNVRSIKQTTGIQNLDSYSYLCEQVPYPPLGEQVAIADYLDRKTTLIDAIIVKKERQIELLREEHTALINRSVTEGLDSNVPMKSSGVEWLKDIPAHWIMSTVRYFFDVKLGKMLNRSKQDQYEHRKPYLRAANIHWKKILLDEVGVNVMGFTEDQLQRYLLKHGDLLVTEGGVTVGRSAIWNGELAECYYQNSLNRARALKKTSTKWLYYWMYFVTNNGYIDILADKATFGHLTNEKLKALPIPIPPTSEQTSIISELESSDQKVESQVSVIQKEIELLREYHTALISDVVTGKIDVRQEAAP